MATGLMQQGFMLMLTGMGTVFVFLFALVLAMNLMSRLLARLPAPAVPVSAGARDEEIAAISAAIRLHRNRYRPS